MTEPLKMWCAQWNTGTGHGVKLQPLTLAFFPSDTHIRAGKMGGTAHKEYEIMPVAVSIEIREREG